MVAPVKEPRRAFFWRVFVDYSKKIFHTSKYKFKKNSRSYTISGIYTLMEGKNASENNSKNIAPPSSGQLEKRTSSRATDVV